MRIEYRKWTDPNRPLAGKLILRPETPEEQAALEDFREHVASPQRGRKFEIIFRRRAPRVGPEQITGMLRQRLEEAEPGKEGGVHGA
ncbi:MAG: hypothetical protein QN174_07770 [Armatimonadota bacterium]|nr:hypothetical protein [Armatimonadota bacterium]